MESEPRFSQNIELVLRDAGWFPERTVSEEQMDSWLIIEWKPENSLPQGYSKIFPAAWRALNEFGGLEINPFRANVTPVAEKFTLNPRLVAEEWPFNQDWHLDEWLVGETLFPLGLWLGYNLSALSISTSGRVFFKFNDVSCLMAAGYNIKAGEVGSLILLGTTIEEALETLILGNFPSTFDVNENRDSSVLVRKILNRIEEREMTKGEWG